MAQTSIPYAAKTCTKCGTTKLLRDFARHKGCFDGLDSSCKTCRTEAARVRKAKAIPRPPSTEPKSCSGCGVTQPADQFYAHPFCRDGLSSRCKTCHAISVKRWHERQPVRERTSWTMAKGRCYNTKNANYPNYGGRGIRMCEAWRTSFETFYRDMGPRPEGTSLNRLDVNGDYEPFNCVWSDHRTQALNKRTTVRLTLGETTLTLEKWAEYSDLPTELIRSRITQGWPPELAVTMRAGRRLRRVRLHQTRP